MFKKSLVLMLILALVVTAFAGCGSKAPTEAEKPAEPKVLKFNLNADPKTIDPQLNSAADGGHIVNNTFEGLMREIDGKLENAMAEKYEISEDGLTYKFTIRDAKWSDGKPVTAHDFEYAWKRALDPATASEYSFQMYYIKGAQAYNEGTGSIEDVAVKALDDKTLEVVLEGPTPYFLELTTFYTFMPTRKDVVEKDPEGWAKNPEITVCNGPFKVTEYKIGDKLILSKNENYWQADKVKLDRIEVSMIVESTTGLTAYEAGELDVIDEVPNQEIPRLQANDPTFRILPQIGTYYYIFNVTKKPTDDVRVRKALSLAIDRTAIVEKVTKGGQIPATGFTPPGLLDADGKEFRTVAGDYGIDPKAAKVEEAKALLAEAGYPDGKGFPELTVLYNTSENHKAIGEAIQEMWKQNLGISVKLQNQEWAVFQDSRHNGNFEIARAGWLGDYADPMTMLDLWLSYSGNNDAQWRNKEYDKLIEDSKKLAGKERFDLLYQAEALMMEEMIVMPIYYYTDPIAVKEHVKGWEKTLLGHWFFGFADIVK
ncbi:oligopeptide transport system substrate-binding protein [Geosporobacter subterraneus DSM 17957]|uniref:Oligopeptide transport system substrate-binding protein n=1 Tax=Geosporobacter subterraneus DSM 17957 TaxID=1121919 RepID=A0A1M6ERS4_9FIRM|nr:peptide ABC transporter substrate-binding protein [Geosporobacter subterraneus]SHI88123.1 oligopeptide transport system substrate-binding protein [Geosporobacter subterraneus DSM 17957]